jgi:hypothetical protein
MVRFSGARDIALARVTTSYLLSRSVKAMTVNLKGTTSDILDNLAAGGQRSE